MPWFKVDDQLDANKKVKSIPRRNRAKAMGLWVQAGAWCARELTDGFVPQYMIEEFAVTPKIAGELVAAGMWEEGESGYFFVNWTEFQPSSNEVRAKKAAEAKRKSEWRATKKAKDKKSSTSEDKKMSQRDNHGTDAGTTTGRTQVSALPDPTRPDPTNKGEGSSTAAPTPAQAQAQAAVASLIAQTDAHRPPQNLDELAAAHADRNRCPKHRGIPEADVPPCRACQHIREANENRQQHADQEARQQRRAAIDACPHCDDNGIRMNNGTATRCTHTNPHWTPPKTRPETPQKPKEPPF